MTAKRPRSVDQRPAHQAARWEWPTLVVFVACLALWFGVLFLPVGWGFVAWPLLVICLTLHSSLTHEILHGHPSRSLGLQAALGVVQLGLVVPYFRFRDLHLAHHQDADLTDPYDDPETNYLDPAVWDKLARWQQIVLRFNNTLLGRMTIGPVIGTVAFVSSDIAKFRAGERQIGLHWLAHVPGVCLVLWIVSLSPMSLAAYLLACYAALSVLRIRTFLEHRAHERASGRSVVIEDCGVLAFLFLNNNFHVVHHMHPQVAWYRLPALYRSQKERFLMINQGYVYQSYAAIFRAFFLKAKDPVAHPLWHPGQK